MTTILGYAQVSTAGQDLDAQPVVLAAHGVESTQMFTDKLSGSVDTDLPGLAALLHYAREDDTPVVTAIDRLGRSIAEFGERRILLRALREAQYDRDSGDWSAKPAGARKAAGRYGTQAEAHDAARGFAERSGGGEVRDHRKDNNRSGIFAGSLKPRLSGRPICAWVTPIG